MRRSLTSAALGFAMLGLSCCAGGHTPVPGQRFPVFFSNAAVTIDPPGQAVVAAAADWARHHPDEPIAVTGYADPRAPQAEVQRLARQRADAVAGLLAGKGVAPERIRRSIGDQALIGITGLGNRRVDIAIGL